MSHGDWDECFLCWEGPPSGSEPDEDGCVGGGLDCLVAMRTGHARRSSEPLNEGSSPPRCGLTTTCYTVPGTDCRAFHAYHARLHWLVTLCASYMCKLHSSGRPNIQKAPSHPERPLTEVKYRNSREALVVSIP